MLCLGPPRFGMLLAADGAADECRALTEECTLDMREVPSRRPFLYIQKNM